ncbi:MAG: DUF721 domain-containing protein [Odoribacteraceae bacterium]|jgi:predicted nucleic acid-binding Zn ribbon protein|nr:DUF721 domain-containing protein [Odoribacteraceae bacterium]
MKQAKTLKLEELMGLYLKQTGLERKFKEMEACLAWPEVVGQVIAAYTGEINMTNGKLFVRFTSPVVRNEMSMVKEGLVKALNDKLGEQVVKDIICR